MTYNDAVARIRKINPGIPIINFDSSKGGRITSLNSATEGTTYFGPSSTVESITEAVGPPKHSSSEVCRCSRCGKAATLVCGGCKDLPAGRGNKTIKTWYCSGTCQKEDWKLHKESCKMAKSRQLLYRAASIAKGLFYVHQETTFLWGYFRKIERHGPYCVVFLDQEKCDMRKNILVPFSTVVDATSDLQEQEALLTHLSCNDAVANFGPFLIEILKGDLLTIEEITVMPKNLRIEILVSQKQSNNAEGLQKDGLHHTILRVTLKNGEQYAVDLTGAQYGHYQECLLWQDYLTTRIGKIIQIDSFGTAKRFLAEEADKRGYPRDRIQSLNLSFSQELRLSIQYWKDHGGSFDIVLASSDMEYQNKKKTLLELVKKLMEATRDDSIQKGFWRLD